VEAVEMESLASSSMTLLKFLNLKQIRWFSQLHNTLSQLVVLEVNQHLVAKLNLYQSLLAVGEVLAVLQAPFLTPLHPQLSLALTQPNL
jgi:hypothetical protein